METSSPFLIGPLLAAFFMSANSAPALAQTLTLTCALRESWVEFLQEKHGEQVVARGLVDETRVLEVFAAPDGATWTVVITNVEGLACAIASGENWERVSPKLLKPTGLPV